MVWLFPTPETRYCSNFAQNFHTTRTNQNGQKNTPIAKLLQPQLAHATRFVARSQNPFSTN